MPSDDQRMKAFVSYARSSSDVQAARRLSAALERIGIRAWVDEQQLHPGDNWYKGIGEALSEAQAMIVLVTPASMKSEWVSRELGYALAHTRLANRVIAVFVGKGNQGSLPWFIGRLPHVLLNSNEDRAAAEIADHLKHAGKRTAAGGASRARAGVTRKRREARPTRRAQSA